MKRLALTISISAVVLGTVAASAADMAPRYTKAPVAAPIMTYSWTGCYIGGNVGGGWERVRQTQIAKVGGPAIVPNNESSVNNG
jgi:outer membrane immunogenic protein